MTQARREVGILGLVVILGSVLALYMVWFAAQHTIRPDITVTPTTTTVTVRVPATVAAATCVTRDGHIFRTSPAVARQLHCEVHSP